MKLSEEVHEILSEWAGEEERTFANLLSYIATKAAKERQQQQQQQEASSPKKDKQAL